MNAQFLINERITELSEEANKLVSDIEQIKETVMGIVDSEPYRASALNARRQDLLARLRGVENLIYINKNFLTILGCDTTVMQ